MLGDRDWAKASLVECGGDGPLLGARGGRRRNQAGRDSAVWPASASAQAGPGAVCART